MKTLDQFISDWTGKGIDYDGAYGFQLNRPIFGLGHLSGLNSVFFFVKPPKWNNFIHNLYLSLPLISLFRKVNTSNPRSIVYPNISISKIGRISTNSKIRSSIIKSVVIYVVNIFPLLCSSNPPLHFNKIISRKSFLNEKIISFFANTPFSTKFFYPGKVTVIYNYLMSSILFAFKSYLFHINQSITRKPNIKGGIICAIQ